MYKRPVIRKPVFGPWLPVEHKPQPVVEPTVWSFKFVPVKYLDSYLSALKRNGSTDEEIEQIREKHYREPELPKKSQEKWVSPVKKLDDIFVTLSVKGGKVKLNIKIPFDEAIPYYKAGKIPPIEVRIRCMKKAGAPKEVLLKMLQSHEEYFSKKNFDKEQKKLDKMFMRFNVKPSQKILKAVKKKIS